VQYQGPSTYDSAATVNPAPLDFAFKPAPSVLADQSTGIIITNEYYYQTFGAGAVSGACSTTDQINWDCGGGITVTTTKSGIATPAVAIQSDNTAALSTRAFTLKTVVPATNANQWATTIKVTWTNPFATNFNDTLTVVHIPTGMLNLPNVADQAKANPQIHPMDAAQGFNISYVTGGPTPTIKVH